MAAQLGIDRPGATGASGFQALIERVGVFAGREEFSIQDVSDDADEGTLRTECERVAAALGLEPERPYLLAVVFTARNLLGDESSFSRSVYAFGKEADKAILAALCGAMEAGQAWRTSRGGRTLAEGEDQPEEDDELLVDRIEGSVTAWAMPEPRRV